MEDVSSKQNHFLFFYVQRTPVFPNALKQTAVFPNLLKRTAVRSKPFDKNKNGCDVVTNYSAMYCS